MAALEHGSELERIDADDSLKANSVDCWASHKRAWMNSTQEGVVRDGASR